MGNPIFKDAERCVVMGLWEGHNFPQGTTISLEGWKDVVLVDRHYMLSRATEVLSACARIDEAVARDNEAGNE